jgi:sporulation protein YlmC with PRC-barrel domain
MRRAAFYCVAIILITAPSTAVLGDDTPKGPEETEKNIQKGDSESAAWRASQFLSMTVYNQKNERIGAIVDMVGDVSGKVIYLVLSHGGFLGIGDKLVPIPWEAANPGEKPGTLVVRLNKEQLEKAPNFPAKKWPDFTKADWKKKTADYYRSLLE